uniref:Uncharacterized protein n=1 Tax=Zea mays TaxID=4577 RepID=B4FLY1_MAIZE|nr:unknown [Zea mays]
MKQPRASEHAEHVPVVIPIAAEHEDLNAVGNEDALVRNQLPREQRQVEMMTSLMISTR